MRSILFAVIVLGCQVGPTDELDEDVDDVMLDRIAHYRELTRLNDRPLPSELGPFLIDCYVAGDVASYREIHPDTAGSNARVAEGTVIVRVVLDGVGRPEKLTVMGKGPPGFDRTFGDWWFAVTDPHGIPLVDGGVLQIGRLAACHDCHRGRARDDFLFGVP